MSKESHNIVMYINKYDSYEVEDIISRIEFILLLYKEFPYNESKKIFSPFIEDIYDSWTNSIYTQVINLMKNNIIEYNNIYKITKDVNLLIDIYDTICGVVDFGFNQNESKQLIEFINKYEGKNYRKYFKIEAINKYSVVSIYLFNDGYTPIYNIFNMHNNFKQHGNITDNKIYVIL